MRNLITMIIFLVSLPFLLGSDCEKKRLESLDNGLMTTSEGIELHPMVLPWEVVASEFEHPEAFDSAMEKMNGWFSPTVAFTGNIDPVRYSELEVGADTDRYGIVLVSVGQVGTPEWTSGLDFEDAGGIANLVWNEDGEILFVDVIVNIDYAYDEATTERVLLHELGHSLGLAHDEDSIDLGSCMSSPPPYDCEIIEADRQRVIQNN